MLYKDEVQIILKGESPEIRRDIIQQNEGIGIGSFSTNTVYWLACKP
jgi:hypothetical protein